MVVVSDLRYSPQRRAGWERTVAVNFTLRNVYCEVQASQKLLETDEGASHGIRGANDEPVVKVPELNDIRIHSELFNRTLWSGGKHHWAYGVSLLYA